MNILNLKIFLKIYIICIVFVLFNILEYSNFSVDVSIEKRINICEHLIKIIIFLDF